jgi:uncharacterized protein YdcH (DUF465 family)
MTQSREPDNFQKDTNRRFRDLDWRIERLETSQMPSRSLTESFDRVYDEIDALEAIINRRFDNLEQRFDSFEQESRAARTELNQKIDTIMQHLTGFSGNS